MQFPTDTTTPNASITEIAYAERAGIPRDTIKSYRDEHLELSVDWLLESRRVVFTESGLAKLAAHFEVESEKIEKKGAEIQPPTPPAPAVPDVLKVVKCPRNRRIVLAVALNAEDEARETRKPTRHHPVTSDDQAGQVYRVRVRNSRNFVRGMEIPVRHQSADLFELKGNQPRFRGRF